MKNNLLLIFIFTVLLGCSSKVTNEVQIIKQWHLSPNTITTDIAASMSLPQFRNQKDIYVNVSQMIRLGKTSVIIAEGCEGEIDSQYQAKFNGWTMKLLTTKVNSKEFEDIMAPVAMKLKAKFPKLKVICGDNLKLIKENLKTASDLRGFTGFYQRLVESRGVNKKKYDAYKIKIDKMFRDRKIKDPILFTMKKSLDALEQFENLIAQRNNSFLAVAKKYLTFNPIVIIGGLHVNDLRSKLYVASIPHIVKTPLGYSNDEQQLIYALKEILSKRSFSNLIFFQLPHEFQINKFLVKSMLPKEKLMTVQEEIELKKLVKDNLSDIQIPFEVLLSDYDNDGIRDFTLASNGVSIVLSAEDPDWDNDGVDNIIDSTLGDIRLARVISKNQINNNFLSKGNQASIRNKSLEFIKLLQADEVKHELLIIEIFNMLMNKLKKKDNIQIKFLMAKKPSFTYGDNVFFSYIKQSQVMEYYPLKLSNYINKEYQKRFKGVKFEKFINSYVIPLIVHSLGHEIGHSLLLATKDKINSLARVNGWSFNEHKYLGKYLKSSRLAFKKITMFTKDYSYKKKSFKKWMSQYSQYSKEVNLLLKNKDFDVQQKMIKKSIYYINKRGQIPEQKLSFLVKHNITSLYALKNPSEWFAEMYASCIFKIIYPKSGKITRSVELGHLLGLNPSSSTGAFCSSVLK